MCVKMSNQSNYSSRLTKLNKIWLIVMVFWLLGLSGSVQAVTNISELQYFAPDGAKTAITAAKPLTLLVIFKPDCKDCQAELPLVQNIAREFADKLNIALVVYGQPVADVLGFVQQFQIISNIAVYADPDKLAKAQFAIRYVPFLVFFDSRGQLLETMQAENGIIEQPTIETAINRYLAVLK